MALAPRIEETFPRTPIGSMRVLMITAPLPTASRPGTWAAVARQIDSIRSLGIDVEVVQVDGPRGVKYLQALRKLRWRASRADLIHAHYGYCGWVSRLQMRRPVIVSFMGSDLLGVANGSGRISASSRVIVGIDRRLARFVDAVIVKSRQMADLLRPVSAHVIPNGVDLDLFQPLDRQVACERLGWHDRRLRVLFPGNPAKANKGFPLARAAVKVASALLGEPLEVIPLSGIPPKRVPLYLSACDAMLMASYTEGSPNAVKEAMACNLPVVSVPVGDVRELLEEVQWSAVRPRDPQVLGSELARLLKASARSNGREVVQARGLDLSSVAQRVTAVYRRVLGA
jgi:glycosyltransferase involved in cell wall biosynthesis